MAPFLSFTAEEAWKFVSTGKPGESIFAETYSQFPAPDAALLTKWERIRDLRDEVNKKLELLRQEGELGSSLQAEVVVYADSQYLDDLKSLGTDLKFVLITSSAQAVDANGAQARDEIAKLGLVKIEKTKVGETLDHLPGQLFVQATKSAQEKCERCWHYRDDVGHDPAHPTICGRCTSNLFGAGESRSFA
jgi:isoleucyl-tRNA synthetase